MFTMRCVVCAAASAVSAAAVAQELPALPLAENDRAFNLMVGHAGDLLDLRAASAADFDAMIADLAKADVVILAEHHASPPVHEMQLRILTALATQGSITLGMEFFDVEDNDALSSFVSGQTDTSAMLKATGWYKSGGYSFKYYEPLVNAAREKRAPVVGLNVPRDWVKTISSEGFSALSKEQQSAIGEPAPEQGRHKYMVAHMMGMPGAVLESGLAVQRAWDGAMAHSIKQARARDGSRTVVAVMGLGHAAHGLGVPAQLARIAPDLSVRIVAPVVAVEPEEDEHLHPGYEPEPEAIISRGFADYVYVLEDDGGQQTYALLGMRLEVTSGGTIGVASVWPGSIADRGGIREGDDIQMIGEAAARDVDEVREMLGSLEFNQHLELVIRRKLQAIPTSILLVPTTDGPADWLTSEVASGVLDSFDPLSDRQYLAVEEPEPTGVSARMIYFRDQPVRIDVMERGRLVETWVLDEHGRPILGLYVDPIEDRTMRHEIDRDEDGKVIAERHIDQWGQVMDTR